MGRSCATRATRRRRQRLVVRRRPPHEFVRGRNADGRRFAAPDSLVLADRFENVREGAVRPGSLRRRKSHRRCDRVGVVSDATDAALRGAHTALVDATCRAYNTWLSEFCAAHPRQLRGVAALNVDDIDTAASELRHAVALGLAAGLIPVGLPVGRLRRSRIRSSVVGGRRRRRAVVPPHRHLSGESRTAEGAGDSRRAGGVTQAGADRVRHRRPLGTTSPGRLIFSGVFERYPALRIVSAEHEVGSGCRSSSSGWTTRTRSPRHERSSLWRRRTAERLRAPQRVGAVLRGSVSGRGVAIDRQRSGVVGLRLPAQRRALPPLALKCSPIAPRRSTHSRKRIAAGNAAGLYGIDVR